jgi:hypothetical protein
MSTSDRMLAVEAVVGAGLVAAAVTVASPDDVWMSGLGLHPGWLPVIVMASRYGPRGMFWGLGVVGAVLIAIGLARGGPLLGLDARLHSGSDLLALLAATLVAWIGMMHESRIGRATARLEAATALQLQAEATERALHDNLGYLRARHDRLELSISVWRDLAARLEGGLAADAADAALELCAIRTGAQAGRVQLIDGDHLSTTACRGSWGAPAARFGDRTGDPTVLTALAARAVTTANEDQRLANECEVAAPILDPHSGAAIAVIALRGLRPGWLRSADVRDLAVVAAWLAPALLRGRSVAWDREAVSA